MILILSVVVDFFIFGFEIKIILILLFSFSVLYFWVLFGLIIKELGIRLLLVVDEVIVDVEEYLVNIVNVIVLRFIIFFIIMYLLDIELIFIYDEFLLVVI